MGDTRIPRAFTSRVPQPQPRAIGTTSRPLQIGAQPLTRPLTPPMSQNPLPKFHPNRVALRRRSKSVGDMNRRKMPEVCTKLDRRPLTATMSRPGTKRPLTGTAQNHPVKPKVAKVKIPDWDYKSRFLDLQGKHNNLIEKYTANVERLGNIGAQEEELEELRVFKGEAEGKLKDLEKLQATLREMQATLEQTVQQLTDCDARKRELNVQLTELQKENANLMLGLEKRDLEIRRMNSEICTYKSQAEALQQDLISLQEKRRAMHNDIQDLKGNIRVFCRVRPALPSDNFKEQCGMSFPNEETLELRRKRESINPRSGLALGKVPERVEFKFDRVFAPESSQGDVFDDLAQLVQSALDGYHVCVFAYGQTGSGKTFTMQGTEEAKGMIPRTVDLIFESIESLKRTNWNYKVFASFLEIYNEAIRDLLVPNSNHNYGLMFNKGQGVTVKNLKTVSIESSAALKRLMDEANRNRATASTDFNVHSSRSHAVCRIELQGTNATTGSVFSGSVNLVDLAGSESAKTSSGERLQETKCINKSLSTLSNVMMALHQKSQHVPYRDSKLTFLLQGCLGGNSKTLMFVNISPFEDCFNESVSSLRFAEVIKEVKTRAVKNKAVL